MVKKILTTVLICICFLVNCNNDLSGFLGSTDLDKRLKERNNFIFLKPEDRSLSLGEEYSFIVITDIHILNRETHGLEKLIDVVANEGIDFVVFNGDISQSGYSRDLQKFIEIAGLIGVPCYPVIGNHDIYFGNWSVWKSLIGSTCYRIDDVNNNATLFILDSANAYLGKEQLDWLERKIKNTGGRVFVFSHVNIFAKGRIHLHFTDVRERTRILSILKDRCDIMFMGHLHRQLEYEAGGVRYLTVESYKNNRTYYKVLVTGNGIRGETRKL